MFGVGLIYYYGITSYYCGYNITVDNKTAGKAVKFHKVPVTFAIF